MKPRGRLKVFFGACAGVGKTYAMLQEAQRLRSELDVLVGVVETHGRSSRRPARRPDAAAAKTHPASRPAGA